MPEQPRKVRPTPEMFEPVRTPMELRCVPCGRKGKYLPGRICLDPDVTLGRDPDRLNKSFTVTRYFHCKHCGAGGPWELTPSSIILLTALMAEALHSPQKARIHLAKLTLFDGTTSRWPTQGEAHLKGLIERDPDNYFLWSRLGNLYQIGEAPDLALEAFHQAVERNEHDVESLHSIAEIHLDHQEKEEAARYFHQVLLHARHAPAKTPPGLVRSVVRDALETLFQLHLESNKRIPVYPKVELPADADSSGPVVVRLENYDLSNDRDWERLVDMWVPGTSGAPSPPNPPASSWSLSSAFSGRPGRPGHPRTGHPGRNDPCPCGSGKKFKKCCMRS
jgi:hypothetical protein